MCFAQQQENIQINSLKGAYEKVKNNKNAFLLLLCNGLSGMEESILTTLQFINDDFKIIGGSAGDNLEFKETPIYIGSPMKVNSDKSITFYCQLVPNTFVQVLEAINPVEEIKSTLKTAHIKPHFVFAINCILRSLKFQQENLWPDIDKELINFCSNITGFISYGEQFHKMHSNQTMVMLLVE